MILLRITYAPRLRLSKERNLFPFEKLLRSSISRFSRRSALGHTIRAKFENVIKYKRAAPSSSYYTVGGETKTKKKYILLFCAGSERIFIIFLEWGVGERSFFSFKFFSSLKNIKKKNRIIKFGAVIIFDFMYIHVRVPCTNQLYESVTLNRFFFFFWKRSHREYTKINVFSVYSAWQSVSNAKIYIIKITFIFRRDV